MIQGLSFLKLTLKIKRVCKMGFWLEAMGKNEIFMAEVVLPLMELPQGAFADIFWPYKHNSNFIDTLLFWMPSKSGMANVSNFLSSHCNWRFWKLLITHQYYSSKIIHEPWPFLYFFYFHFHNEHKLLRRTMIRGKRLIAFTCYKRVILFSLFDDFLVLANSE